MQSGATWRGEIDGSSRTEAGNAEAGNRVLCPERTPRPCRSALRGGGRRRQARVASAAHSASGGAGAGGAVSRCCRSPRLLPLLSRTEARHEADGALAHRAVLGCVCVRSDITPTWSRQAAGLCTGGGRRRREAGYSPRWGSSRGRRRPLREGAGGCATEPRPCDYALAPVRRESSRRPRHPRTAAAGRTARVLRRKRQTSVRRSTAGSVGGEGDGQLLSEEAPSAPAQN